VFKKGEHKKIIDLIVMMLSSNTLPFYAEFSTYMNYYEASNIPTMGVNVGKNGMNMYWNRKFVDSLLPQDLLFILIHENFHLLFDHTKRSVYYNKELANIAQDMIINTIIDTDIVKKINNKTSKGEIISIPKDREEFIKDENGNVTFDDSGNPIKNPRFGENIGLFLPKEYKGNMIFEDLYEWIRNKQDEYKERKQQQSQGQQGQQQQGQGQQGQSGGKSQKNGKQGQGQGQGQGEQQSQNGDGNQQGQGGGQRKDSFGKPVYGQNGQNNVDCCSLDSIFDSLEKGEQVTLDNHLDDDVSPEARQTVVNDFTQRLKNRGLVTSDIEETLNKLKKSKKNYLKEIKRVASNHIMGTTKMKSISKPNRHGIEGLKGKKKYKNVINCILDTSGSMCGDFEKVLSYIFQNEIHINMVQIDTEVKAAIDIKNKKDLQKMKINGGGGTVLQPAIDFISEPKNKMVRYHNLILTDGYTDTLSFTNIKTNTLILTTGCRPPLNDPNGKVKVIEIDLNESINN
jgi:predicted metal-dependent peptidase